MFIRLIRFFPGDLVGFKGQPPELHRVVMEQKGHVWVNESGRLQGATKHPLQDIVAYQLNSHIRGDKE